MPNVSTLPNILQQAHRLALLRDIDLAVVDFIQHQQAIILPTPLALGMALTSRHAAQGHVCIDVAKFFEHPHELLNITQSTWVPAELTTVKQSLLQDLGQLFLGTDFFQWLEQWQQCPVITYITDSNSTLPAASAQTPFVLDTRHAQPLLYMYRYWHYECCLHQFISQKCQQAWPLPATAPTIIAQLFPPSLSASLEPLLDSQKTDWQKIATAIAVQQGFSIITGGPGTGKTTTVLKLLCLLQALCLEQNKPVLKIALTAPTGKAASRLNESIADNLANIDLPESTTYQSETLRAAIPTEATTLHRLLGSKPNSRHFRHHAKNPLSADIVVVDEASMIDLETMTALVQALTSYTRLILIGDKDQLASVEAGSVLGDLCSHAHLGNYTHATVTAIAQLTGDTLPTEFHNTRGAAIAQATCMLRHSYRFQANGAIARLAKLINEDPQNTTNISTVDALLALAEQETQNAEVEIRQAQLQTYYQPDALESKLLEVIVHGYRAWLVAANTPPADPTDTAITHWAQAILAARNHFQVLVAVNQGPQGLHAINALIETTLMTAGLFTNANQHNYNAQDLDASQHWYHGRPVMVTHNDYSLNLMNGDMGICLNYPDPNSHQHRLAVLFNNGKGGIRWVLPSRLRHVETAFAMTVHKSQGSEFNHALLLLPNQSNPVLNKELMYTGITRARQCFSLVYGNTQVLHEAVTTRIERASGLSGLFFMA